MNCLAQAIHQTLDSGYAHHIQRLVVTGLYALLVGGEPRQMHGWYLSVCLDAVEWVEMPGTLGMSQFADGGILASKPYAASDRYIDRMSNYCRGCRFNPGKAVGGDACPFTTLNGDFLDRHRARHGEHPRAIMQWRSLDRLDAEDLKAIRTEAARLRAQSVCALASTSTESPTSRTNTSSPDIG